MSTPILSVENLSISFGGLAVIAVVTLTAPEGGCVALIGPKGAGKTAIFNLLSGVDRRDKGLIRLGGAMIDVAPRGRASGSAWRASTTTSA